MKPGQPWQMVGTDLNVLAAQRMSLLEARQPQVSLRNQSEDPIIL
jgi:hypothetical protein